MPPPDPDARRGSQSRLNNTFPNLKKWGNRRVLRCLNVNKNGDLISCGRRSVVAEIRAPVDVEEPERDDDGLGFEEVKAKLLVHLQAAAEKMDRVVPKAPAGPPPLPLPATAYVGDRTRRKASIRMDRTVDLSPPAEMSKPGRTVRLRSEGVEKRKRPDFSITLSKDEIAEDVYALTGLLPRRRPRRRTRVVQKQLDSLFPASWLTEVTADLYKVPI